MKWPAANSGLIGSGKIPVKEQWLLLDELYKVSAICSATVVIVISALIGMIHSPSAFFVLWAISGLIFLCGRLLLSRTYRRRDAGANIERWTFYFSAASAATGLHWGAGAAAFCLDVDWTTRMSVFAVECALITGTSGRSYAAPRAAISQVSLACLGFIVIFVDREEWLMSGIVAIYLCFNVSDICRLGGAALERIQAECGRRELVDMLAASNEKLSALNLRLEQMAFTDSLTGLANRRGFDAYLSDACVTAAITRRPLALLIADVDHFKRFNDNYGHLAGDACLASIATALKTSLDQPRDFAARYGGEEFAVVLPETSLADAVRIANRIRNAVSTITLSAQTGDEIRITVSIGGASLEAGSDLGLGSLLHLADEALYRAKSEGRDCVRFAPGPFDS